MALSQIFSQHSRHASLIRSEPVWSSS